MNVLIAVGSRHGSTREIAEAIADELRLAGHHVDVRDASRAGTVAGYDAVVLGSAVYLGSWLEEARRLVERSQPDLAARPVWLFSSGPVGPPTAAPLGPIAHLDELVRATHARDHRIFAGRLDRTLLGLGERLAVAVVRAPDGDFRDWSAIRAWARRIAAALADLQGARPVPEGTPLPAPSPRQPAAIAR